MRWFLSVALTCAVLGACATPGERTAVGAGDGAAVGAGVGAIAGGWEGAAIGAVVGGVAGDRIGLEGHTDSTGSAAHDEELSLRRAEAVRDVLASRGVNPRQMLVAGAGAARPIADNSTPEGRAQNRRVEVYIDVPNRS